MRKKILTIALFVAAQAGLFAQKIAVEGTISDARTKNPLPEATVKIGTQTVISSIDGKYRIELDKAGKYSVTISYVGYLTLSLQRNFTEGPNSGVDFALEESVSLLQTATVTSGKFEKPLSEVTVSLDVLKPQLIENVNTRKVDDVLQKVPGVNIIDGQANIRGGSGWSYGAGSRVLLLIDDIPALQADAGFPNWKDVPVENIEQIEVVKGASSALYGSSAMNGIINIRTGFAKSEPETKISSYYVGYMPPKDAQKHWWKGETAPYEAGGSIAHKQKFGKLDVAATGFYYNFSSYNKGWYDKFGRATVATRYRINDRLSVGLNVNYNKGNSQNFFYWLNNTTGAYVGTPSAYSSSSRERFFIDPYLNYFDKKGNRHKILTRLYSVKNNANNNQQNQSKLFYGEYQFQREFSNNLVVTAGLVAGGTSIQAQLYGDTSYASTNFAAYAQADKKWGKLNVSAGVRFEQNTIYGPDLVSFVRSPIFGGGTFKESNSNGGSLREAKPVFRLGLNYQVAKATFLRGSIGQGYRFPTVAEMYISTLAGSIPVNPNPGLKSETGWSAELGVKQGVAFGAFKGFADAAIFWQQYDNMMEFLASSDARLRGTFQSQNIGDTRIKGAEISFAGQGNFGKFSPSVWVGYTYIDPIYRDYNATVKENSTDSSNVLKYRFRHNFKLDAEANYGDFSVGVAVLYNSRMESVDRILEVFLPGIRAYREANQKGFTTVDVRISYKILSNLKISAILANATNAEYTYRPGLLEAPRNVQARIDWKF